jgi:hypothetical protein
MNFQWLVFVLVFFAQKVSCEDTVTTSINQQKSDKLKSFCVEIEWKKLKIL